MSNTLIKIYDDFSVAQNAREQLLASGFSPSSVHLSAPDDEAGPVEGNFTVGDNYDEKKGAGGMLRSLLGGSDDPHRSDDVYTRKYSNVVQRGTYMLKVDADDEDETARASNIMNLPGEAQSASKNPGSNRGT